MSAKPNNNRRLVAIIAAAVFAVAVLTGLAVAKLASSDSDSEVHRPTAPVTTPVTTPAAEPVKIIAMSDNGAAGNDRQFAMLEFQVMPQGGQLTGISPDTQPQYTLVTFDQAGQTVGLEHPTPFGGTGGESTFQLEGLTDYGVVTGNLLGDGSPGTILHFDRTFGPEVQDWKIISSAQKFRNVVETYAQEKFGECSKKHEPEPCEGVR